MIIHTEHDHSAERESDGRYKLQLKSKTAVSRWQKREEERERRRQEIIEQYGSDDLLWA